MDVRIDEAYPQHAVVIDYHATVDQMGEKMGSVIGELLGTLRSQHVEPDGMPFSIYPDPEPDDQGVWHVITGVPVHDTVPESGRITNYDVPGGLVAKATYIGPYDSLHEAYVELEEAVRDKGYMPGGPILERYLTSPDREPDPSKWRTEIYMPIVERGLVA